MTTPLALVRGTRRARRTSEPRPGTLGLVLSGGGARGAFQVGVHDRAVLSAMHAAGRCSAEKWLAAGPRLDCIDEPAAQPVAI